MKFWRAIFFIALGAFVLFLVLAWLLLQDSFNRWILGR